MRFDGYLYLDPDGGAGWPFQLRGTGPGWGDLVVGGVNVDAGETKVLDVSEKVPEASVKFGRVMVGCTFNYAGLYDPEHEPSAGDRALLPGGIGGIRGDAAYFPQGRDHGGPRQPIAGVRVVLTSEGRCPIVAEAISDANGFFEFTNLPVGPDYKLFAFPPAGWRITNEDREEFIWLLRDKPVDGWLDFIPGDGPLPTQPADCTPPAVVTPAAHGGLASTGANVIGLSGFGAVALLVGAAAVFSTRRRRTPAR
ncbi:carboxypeptidase-like regulatory domain-containing protein [Actinocrispum wychmicini]|uniref:carboxypeptidase-like regulatory domain-containing protein n=1 Tax=Actinocrispum wychmicini TaxID=1213861 RepID=UPI00140514D8|nr:carboxypeptidase-like regulatory domain-containing protein [Actinocrispum wychmicini]